MKQEITREGYLFLVWLCLIGGSVMTAIFSSLFIMKVEIMYSAFYWALGMLVTGFGVGLSVARAFKIRRVD